MQNPEIIVITAPTVPTRDTGSFPYSVIYSVQLANGLVITNPTQFPTLAEEVPLSTKPRLEPTHEVEPGGF